MKADIAIAGGGLSGGIIAAALAHATPGLKILLIEKSTAPDAAKTWSFHRGDITDEWYARLKPHLRGEWAGQQVDFPKFHRHLSAGYASLDAAGLQELLHGLGVNTLWQSEVTDLDQNHARLADGRIVEAPCVLDGRGHEPGGHVVNGWQKFLGVEYEMAAPHGVDVPVIMDARVPQIGGFRFVYLLPFSATKILVEDTCYSTDPVLDAAQFENSIQNYLTQKQWAGEIIRKERGVLPIPMAYDTKSFWADQSGAVPVGMRAGLFHPVTGYSLPVATRLADRIAQSDLRTDALREMVGAFALEEDKRNRYLRLLNRMLFEGAGEADRYRILERFYTLPQGLIERFYAGQLTRRDRLRILMGKPPIKIGDALKCLNEAKFLGGTNGGRT